MDTFDHWEKMASEPRPEESNRFAEEKKMVKTVVTLCSTAVFARWSPRAGSTDEVRHDK